MKVADLIKRLQQHRASDDVSLMSAFETNAPEKERVTMVVHRNGIVMKDLGKEYEDENLNYYFKE